MGNTNVDTNLLSSIFQQIAIKLKPGLDTSKLEPIEKSVSILQTALDQSIPKEVVRIDKLISEISS
jgi:hypothetical protein